MIPAISVLVVVALSLVVTRVASVALVHTGMGREAARFQARSAFTGAGFTTSEAEAVVSHPIRRRIIGWLMVAGNVGIVTTMSSLLLSLIDLGDGQGAWLALGVLVSGLFILLILASSQFVDRNVSRLISWALTRFTKLDTRDYARLLHLREDYGVSDLRVGEEEWLAGKSLDEAGLAKEGILVLGIECPGGSFIGAPAKDTKIFAADRIILYGRTPCIAEVDRRRPEDGAAAHQTAVEEQDARSRREHEAAGR